MADPQNPCIQSLMLLIREQELCIKLFREKLTEAVHLPKDTLPENVSIEDELAVIKDAEDRLRKVWEGSHDLCEIDETESSQLQKMFLKESSAQQKIIVGYKQALAATIARPKGVLPDSVAMLNDFAVLREDTNMFANPKVHRLMMSSVADRVYGKDDRLVHIDQAMRNIAIDGSVPLTSQWNDLVDNLNQLQGFFASRDMLNSLNTIHLLEQILLKNPGLFMSDNKLEDVS